MDPLPSSFRDPSGFVFAHDSTIYRQVNTCFSEQFEHFATSGLYEALVARKLILSHEEVTDQSVPRTEDCYKLIKPQQLAFISYPYEWSFSQFKDAAMLTLKVQATALKHGFVLKDASAFNIQFLGGKPVFIDTLSFEPYVEGRPWVAYKQFCQHFFAPLALMAYCDIEMSRLFLSHIDGIPLSLASQLLPWKTRFTYSLQAHIHLHSRMQDSYADSAGEGKSRNPADSKVSKRGLQGLTESLASAVNKLEWKMPKTEWGDYYANTNYSDRAAEQKRAMVDSFLGDIPEKLAVVQDFGANTGEFSRVAANHCELVVSQDIDPVAIELNYLENKASKLGKILPLIQNLTAPSPAIGWGNEERSSFIERSNCDALLVLALIHHLAISNNVPLGNIARLFSRITRWLVIEFVPKSDSQVERLLATREDIFENYTLEGFEVAFSRYFTIERAEKVPETDRVLYLLKQR